MKYIKKFKVGFHQTDANFNLKPYEFFYMAQDAATEHCDINHCGFPDLIKDDLAWMLVKMNVEFVKMPVNMQDVVMKTWHKGQTGPVFFRDYILESEEGEVLVKGTSIWATVNVKTRSLARPECLYLDSALENDDAIVDKSLKLQINTDAPLVNETTHTVQYADVDCNSHANNTAYLVWAFNALPYERLVEHPVKSCEICYLNECRPMTSVKISVYSADNVEYGIKMQNEEGKSLCLIRVRL